MAHLALALEVLLAFAVDCAVITREAAGRQRHEAWMALLAESGEARADRDEEAPARLFLRLLADGFASRAVYLDDAESDSGAFGWEVVPSLDEHGGEAVTFRHAPGATALGRLDGEWLQLLPDATYQFVQAAARKAGRIFPVELRTLLVRLEEAGVIATEKDGDSTRREVKVRWGSTTRRVIKLHRSALTEEAPSGASEREQREQREHDFPADVDVPAERSRNGVPRSATGNNDREQADSNLARVPAVPAVPGELEEKGRRSTQDLHSSEREVFVL